MPTRVQPQQYSENRTHSLYALPQAVQPRRAHAGQLLQPLYFEFELPAAFAGQTIRLFVARCVVLLETLDPPFVQEPAQRAIQRARAQADTLTA